MSQPNQGEVISIRGSVIDARFQKHLPKINNLLIAGDGIMVEVLIHLSPEVVRGIAFNSTQGLARGTVVTDLGHP